MEKITDKIAALPPDSDYFSLEFFPPKTSMGTSNLRARLDRMSRALRPLFVTVTWGAGGSTADKSLELAELTQRELGLTTCLHLTCTNMNRALVDRALEEAKVLGVRNILALRGDTPRSDEYRLVDENGEGTPAQEEDFTWGIDLVRYIRKKYGDYFCVGVAAYPEGHADESYPEKQGLEHDLPYLVEKVQAGADFIMTQLFFDVEAYDKFERTLREHESGVFKDIPIIPGLMPIQSYQILKRTAKLSHAKLPEDIEHRLDVVRRDDEMVKKVGVDIVCEIVEKVKEIKSRTPGPRGFHFYTLNLEKAVSFVLERTKMIPASSTPPSEDDFAVVDMVADVKSLSMNGSSGVKSLPAFGKRSARRQSSVGSDPHNRVIVDQAKRPDLEASAAEAGIPKEPINTRANTLAISEGEGALGREATWDDFPNGRWGDARSPAYGEIDGYGVSLHMSVSSATKLWGYPTTASDITELFIRHLTGDLSAIPWSEQGLNPETDTIREHLLALNKKGWWTVASQPAVNGLRSSDPTFGWGPRNGFVFQKAFVEFFLPSTSWAKLRPILLANEDVSFYATNSAGDFESSDSGGHGQDTQAVTWGAFPGKEIVTPTIIEEVSFKAWCEEAFGIWAEWQRVYPPRTQSAKLIGGIREDYWLVNIIHHAYVKQAALWELLVNAPV
jgi:methylenetetrahydrofolate reductase (NADPH)